MPLGGCGGPAAASHDDVAAAGLVDLATLPGLRHLGGSEVRMRTKGSFTETMDDYLDIFEDLQVDSSLYDVFWNDVIHRYRQSTRHAPLLKRGTDASIKSMTDDLLRAYGERIWRPDSGWRRGLAEVKAMLVYEKDGVNPELREILNRLWWRMRELVFEAKPPPKARGGSHSRTTSLKRKRVAVDQLSDGDEAYAQTDLDNNRRGIGSTEGRNHDASRSAQARASRKLDKIAAKVLGPEEDRFLTFQQTEQGIINIIEQLHDLRLASHPDRFNCLWNAHIGRVEEVEACVEPYEIVSIGQDVDQAGFPPTSMDADRGGDGSRRKDAADLQDDMSGSVESPSGCTKSPARIRRRDNRTASGDTAADALAPSRTLHRPVQGMRRSNLSGEPFNSLGAPASQTLTERHVLSSTLPELMSIWITTFSPQAPSPQRAYHHPAAPVREQDMEHFFRHVTHRADNITGTEVQGYALSYGWCDISRWIEKTLDHSCSENSLDGRGPQAGGSEGERLGWQVFQRDLVDAAKAGVMVWRMKVLVVKRQDDQRPLA